jgi:PHD/YefM family antitoxin component YafN of YafNO toxin-antitoxin module
MYQTEGVSAIASITDLRLDPTSLIEASDEHPTGIAIQRNGEPELVLLSWTTYQKLKDAIDLDSL